MHINDTGASNNNKLQNLITHKDINIFFTKHYETIDLVNAILAHCELTVNRDALKKIPGKYN